MEPNFHDPVDTAQDLVDNNTILFTWPGGHIWRQFLLSSPIKEYQILGNSLYVTKDYDEFDSLTANEILKASTHARITAFLREKHLKLGEWYRSDDVVAGRSSNVGYLTAKNWFLNEESQKINSLILYYQVQWSNDVLLNVNGIYFLNVTIRNLQCICFTISKYN